MIVVIAFTVGKPAVSSDFMVQKNVATTNDTKPHENYQVREGIGYEIVWGIAQSTPIPWADTSSRRCAESESVMDFLQGREGVNAE